MDRAKHLAKLAVRGFFGVLAYSVPMAILLFGYVSLAAAFGYATEPLHTTLLVVIGLGCASYAFAVVDMKARAEARHQAFVEVMKLLARGGSLDIYVTQEDRRSTVEVDVSP